MTNIKSVPLDKTCLEAISAVLNAGGTPILWGEPGMGKSSVIEALSQRWGWHHETVTGNVREPGDFAGIPAKVADPDGGDSVAFIAPSWAKRCNNSDGTALVFLDELSTSPPAVQAAMLRVILEKWAGDLKLGDHVRFIAAANPPEIAADGYDISAPLANRLAHFYVNVNLESWTLGMTTGWDSVTPDLSDLRVIDTSTPEGRARWVENTVIVKSRIATFIGNRSALLNKVPEDTASQGHAYPTPRTWEMTAKALGALEDDAEDARSMIVRAYVGEAAAIEYLAWERANDLPKPSAVLANPDVYDWSDSRQDRTFAVLSSVSAYIVNSPTEENWNNAWRVFAAANKCGRGDIAGIFALRSVESKKFNKFTIPKEVQEFAKVLDRINSLQKKD